MDFSFITAIGALIALVVGKVLKDNPTFSNKFIPWVTLVISILTQIVEAAPAQAGINIGGFFSSPFFLQVLVQWLSTTGAHSVAKNAIQGK